MAMTSFLTIENSGGSKIKGDCTQQGREDTFIIYSTDHTVTIPKDTHTGLATGQRIHKPFIVTTDLSAGAPLLLQACTRGEKLSVTQDFYKIDNAGKEVKYYTVKLTNAVITELDTFYPLTFVEENKGYKHMMRIAFSYEAITHTNHVANTEGTDDWSKPNT